MCTHLAEELFKGRQEYVSKVAKTEKDICALVDAGFEYVCDYNDGKTSENANTSSQGPDEPPLSSTWRAR